MLNIQDVHIYGLENAMDYARLPMLPLDDPMACHKPEDASRKDGRAKRLAGAPTGTGHDNFLKGIMVTFLVDFPVKVWVQAERYGFFNFISSMSTMHTLAKNPITRDMFQPYTDQGIIFAVQALWKQYQLEPTRENLLRLLYSTPCGLKVPGAITTNYQQLKTIYFQRKNHTLPEWREFCQWIETLPHFKEWIIGEDTHD